MDASVDHQSDCSPDLVGELTKFGVRILVEPELGAEAFRVESPTFDERGVSAIAPEIGNALQLLRNRDLQMMAGHCFVGGENLHLPDRPAIELVSVDEELSGAMRFGRTRLIVRRCLRRSGVRRNR